MSFFLIIGVKKGGTTFLHNQLRLFSAINLPFIKETHFLFPMVKKRKKKFQKNFKNLFNSLSNQTDKNFLIKFLSNKPNNIHNYFNLLSSEKEINGECDPELFLLNKNLIYEISKKNFKIVCLLRDPVQRFFSHVKMIIKDKNLDPNIYISKNFESLTHQINHSLYSKHLSNWLNIIPNNQILFINSNDLRKYKKETCKKIIRFISDDGNFPFQDSLFIKDEVNVGSEWKLDSKLNIKLQSFFTEDKKIYEETLKSS